MKVRYLYLGLIIFLLPISFGISFNFNSTTELWGGTLGGSNGHASVKGYYDGVTDNWFVYMSQSIAGGGNNVSIYEFDTDWVEQNSDVKDCGSNCYDNNCNYIIETERYFSCVARENDATPDFLIYEYYFDNNSFITVDTKTDYKTYPRTLAVTNRFVDTDSPLILWNKFIRDNDLHYTNTNDADGDGSLDIPSTYHQPDDVELIWCNDYYYLFLENSDTLKALVYNESLDYESAYSFSPTDWVLQSDYYGVDSIDNTIYIAQVNDTLDDNDGGLVNLQAWYCNGGSESGELTQVYTETFNQTDIESTANVTAGKKITSPYLTQDGNDIYHLFYEFDGSVYVAEDFESCTCSNWVNTTECSGDYIKQTRNCFPESCDDTIRFVSSNYCGIKYNQSQGIYTQQNEPEVVCTECETDWLYFSDGDLSGSCKPEPITIPTDAINIEVNATAIGVLDREQGCDKGTYNLEVCSPTYDCSDETFDCSSSVNYTGKHDASYSAGEIVNAKMNMVVESQCRCSGLFGNKVKRWMLNGVLCVRYEIPCEEKWFCLNNEYKALQHIDCTVTNETYCEYGCEDGECAGIKESTDYEKTTFAFYWDRMFVNPNPNTKFFYSIGLSTFVGVIGLVFAKTFKAGKNSMIYFFLTFFGLMFTFFVLVGWIPIVIIIIIAFSVLIGTLLKALK